MLQQMDLKIAVKNLINEAKNYSIEILYLGANQDAILESSKFGLDCTQALTYDENSDNIESAYRSAARVAKRYRTSGTVEFLDMERSQSVNR